MTYYEYQTHKNDLLYLYNSTNVFQANVLTGCKFLLNASTCNPGVPFGLSKELDFRSPKRLAKAAPMNLKHYS